MLFKDSSVWTPKGNIMKKTLIAGLSALALVAMAGVNSGLEKGESVTPFHPTHVAGPLAGTTNCFPCTFQARPQVQVWVNGDTDANLATIAKTLDKAIDTKKAQEFKAMIVILTDAKSKDATLAKATSFAKSNSLKNVDVAVLAKNDEAVSAYKVNTDKTVKNTVFVYKNWKVENKMVNFVADAKGLSALGTAINKIAG